MPSADTFDCGPITHFVKRYLRNSKVSVDPFARNKRWATHTNDINPATLAEHHFEAVDFLNRIASESVESDLVLLDPPYSPRQISECYKEIGKIVTQEHTQNGRFYKQVRDAVMPIIAVNGIVLSFGWNSAGMGKDRGFEIIEIMLVAHGSAHNDTICMAEKYPAPTQYGLL